MVWVKPSRYFVRLPRFAPRWNQSANSCGFSVGSFEYFASRASSTMVRGRKTPSRCSWRSTLGSRESRTWSSFIGSVPFCALPHGWEPAGSKLGGTLGPARRERPDRLPDLGRLAPATTLDYFTPDAPLRYRRGGPRHARSPNVFQSN